MRSRRLLLLVVLVAIAVLWFAFGRKALFPNAVGRSEVPVEEDAPGAASVGDPAGAADAAGTPRPTLALGSDPEGIGAVRVRLLTWRDRRPVAGKAVRLVRASGAPLERTTGEDGRVLFAEVPSGEWTLKVDVPPFAPVDVKGVAVRAKKTTDLDDLLLGDKAVLRGRVVDGKGAPVPGAAVSAFTGGGFDFSQGVLLAMVQEALTFPAPVDETKSDERGAFELASLAPGTYRLATRRAGYAMDVKTDLVVNPDRSAGLLTIVLGPPAVLRGKVVDEKDAPIAGATVLAVEDLGMAGMGRTTLRKDYAVTGPDGRYVLDTLVRGTSYRFGVTAKDRAPTFDARGTVVELETERDFTLALGGVVEGKVVDSATSKGIEGARVVVIVGQIAGGFGGRGGRGGREGGGAAPDSAASTQVATTGPDGSFRMEGLRPGPIAFVQVRAAGYSEPPGPNPFFGAPPAYGEVRPGETTPLEVKLDVGGVVTGRVLASGEGGVVGVAGAQVAVVSMTGFQGQSFPNVMGGYPTGVTDAEGTFRVDGVRAGATFGIVASAPGYVASSAMDAANQGAMPEQPGVVVKDVTLTSAGAVEGVVATSKGVPVPGARVRARPAPRGGGFGGAGWWRMLFPGGGAGIAISDAEGRYRMENVAAADRMVLEAESDEHVPSETEPFEVAAGETKRVDVVLQGGATVRGRVIDEHGKVVPAARLRVGRLDEASGALRELSAWTADRFLEGRIVFADERGAFEIPRVRPGRTLLKAEKEGYVTSYRRDLVVSPDQVVESHVVSLSKGETISGVVRAEDGKPLPRIDVVATKQANPAMRFGGGAAPAGGDAPPEPTVEPMLMGRTDEQGRFTIEAVPPGTSYSVVVWRAPGYRGWMQQDEGAIRRGVAPGSTDVELKLAKADPNPGAAGFPVPGGPRPPTAPPPPAPVVPGMR
jgi:protocatechuate 3,4-dioxygenase beta subunit